LIAEITALVRSPSPKLATAWFSRTSLSNALLPGDSIAVTGKPVTRTPRRALHAHGLTGATKAKQEKAHITGKTTTVGILAAPDAGRARGSPL
jgi:hypothetical protein